MKKLLIPLFLFSSLSWAATIQFTPTTQVREAMSDGTYSYRIMLPEERGGLRVLLRSTVTGAVEHSFDFPDDGFIDNVTFQAPEGTWYASLVTLIDPAVEAGADSDESGQIIITSISGVPTVIEIKPFPVTDVFEP